MPDNFRRALRQLIEAQLRRTQPDWRRLARCIQIFLKLHQWGDSDFSGGVYDRQIERRPSTAFTG